MVRLLSASRYLWDNWAFGFRRARNHGHGEVVQLKSGGSDMTVRGIGRYEVGSDHEQAMCVWFNEKNQAQARAFDPLLENVLRRIVTRVVCNHREAHGHKILSGMHDRSVHVPRQLREDQEGWDRAARMQRKRCTSRRNSRCSSARSTTTLSWAFVKGLVMKSKAPRRIDSTGGELARKGTGSGLDRENRA
jgi:uncharacterized protein YodC (DUF2158 family)